MTIEQLNGLSGGNIVKLNDILYCCLGWNFTTDKRKIYHFEAIDSDRRMKITELLDQTCQITVNGVKVHYDIYDVSIAEEKEVLEIQLKDAEEQVQKETARVDSIKAKLEELSKPKLKIGGLYKFKFNGNPNSTLGVLYACSEGLGAGKYYYFITPGLNRLTVDFTTPNGNGIDFNAIKKSEFKEITNPKYSHIGKTIMEFIALNQKNFQ